jgi:transcriptional regulator with XRE-family HTH domain
MKSISGNIFDNNTLSYGQKIKKIREFKGLKAYYVAGKLGLSRAMYSKIENDHTDITVARLEEIAAVFEVPVSLFFQGN